MAPSTGRYPIVTVRVAAVAARQVVGRRNAGRVIWRVRSSTVGRALGSGGVAGTARAAQTATPVAIRARVVNSAGNPARVTSADPSRGPVV